MLRALDLRAVQRPAVIARQPVRIFLAAQPAEDEDAARRAKMKQLFGIDEVQPYKPTRKEREEEAYAIRERAADRIDSLEGSVKELDARIQALQSELEEAEEPMQRALAIFEKSLGSDHPNVATLLNNLASLLKVHRSTTRPRC